LFDVAADCNDRCVCIGIISIIITGSSSSSSSNVPTLFHGAAPAVRPVSRLISSTVEHKDIVIVI